MYVTVIGIFCRELSLEVGISDRTTRGQTKKRGERTCVTINLPVKHSTISDIAKPTSAVLLFTVKKSITCRAGSAFLPTETRGRIFSRAVNELGTSKERVL
jgi:hypothetical protein